MFKVLVFFSLVAMVCGYTYTKYQPEPVDCPAQNSVCTAKTYRTRNCVVFFGKGCNHPCDTSKCFTKTKRSNMCLSYTCTPKVPKVRAKRSINYQSNYMACLDDKHNYFTFNQSNALWVIITQFNIPTSEIQKMLTILSFYQTSPSNLVVTKTKTTIKTITRLEPSTTTPTPTTTTLTTSSKVTSQVPVQIVATTTFTKPLISTTVISKPTTTSQLIPKTAVHFPDDVAVQHQNNQSHQVRTYFYT